MVVQLGDAGDRHVEAHLLHALAHRVDRAVQRPQRVVVGRGAVGGRHRTSPVSSSTTLRQMRCSRRYTPTTALVSHGRLWSSGPGEHLVQPQRVGAVALVHLVGRHRVPQALAHLPELAPHLLVAVPEAAVALDDRGGVDVQAPGVGVGGGLDHALVEQPPVRLERRHVPQVVEHLVPEPGVQQVQHRVLGAADVQVDAAAVAVAARAHPVALVLGVDEGALSFVGSR